jgi:hypothetical protein
VNLTQDEIWTRFRSGSTSNQSRLSASSAYDNNSVSVIDCMSEAHTWYFAVNSQLAEINF